MAKFDVQSAYRLLPVQGEDSICLGPTIVGQIFTDKMLPMGAKTGAAHWEAFGHLWKWMVQNASQFHGSICRYVDNMLCVFQPDSDPTCSITALEVVCAEIGLPLAPNRKTLKLGDELSL